LYKDAYFCCTVVLYRLVFVVTARCRQYAVLEHPFYDDKSLSLLLVESVVGDSGRPALVLLPISPSTDADSLVCRSKISLSSTRETFPIDDIW